MRNNQNLTQAKAVLPTIIISQMTLLNVLNYLSLKSPYWKRLSEELLKILIIQNNSFISGINKYSLLTDVSKNKNPSIAQILSSELLNFTGQGQPVLIIPSLINGSDILNFSDHKSLVNSIRNQGFDVYMINWLPERHVSESDFGFWDYVENIIIKYAEIIHEKTGNLPLVLGHCMGGILATFAAFKYPDKFKGLATISMPWNFDNDAFIKVNCDVINKILANYLIIPKDFISAIFAIVNFDSIYRKYIDFESNLNSESARIERWLNDGLDMSKKLFMECTQHLINDNCLMSKSYLIKQDILPIKTIQFIGKKDKVVPRLSSIAFSEIYKDSKIKEYDAGHLGLVIKYNDDIAVELLKFIVN